LRLFAKLSLVTFAIIDLLLMIVTSVIILHTTFKSSQHVMHFPTRNQLSRADPVPKTIKVDPYYREYEYGGVYLGSSSHNLQQSEDILNAEEPSLNNIATIEEQIVELNASTLEDSEENNFQMLPHRTQNAVRKSCRVPKCRRHNGQRPRNFFL
jgi:hypothetical protein